LKFFVIWNFVVGISYSKTMIEKPAYWKFVLEFFHLKFICDLEFGSWNLVLGIFFSASQ